LQHERFVFQPAELAREQDQRSTQRDQHGNRETVAIQCCTELHGQRCQHHVKYDELQTEGQHDTALIEIKEDVENRHQPDL